MADCAKDIAIHYQGVFELAQANSGATTAQEDDMEEVLERMLDQYKAVAADTRTIETPAIKNAMLQDALKDEVRALDEAEFQVLWLVADLTPRHGAGYRDQVWN